MDFKDYVRYGNLSRFSSLSREELKQSIKQGVEESERRRFFDDSQVYGDTNIFEKLTQKEKVINALNISELYYNSCETNTKKIGLLVYRAYRKRYATSDTIASSSLWENWRKITTEITENKRHWNDNRDEMVAEFRKKLKPLYMETITEVLCEVLIQEPDFQSFYVRKVGIDVYTVDNPYGRWGNKISGRYRFPDDINNVLVLENHIIDANFAAEVFRAWYYEVGHIIDRFEYDFEYLSAKNIGNAKYSYYL